VNEVKGLNDLSRGARKGQPDVPTKLTGMNEGPTCYTRKPHWNTAKKACNVDQYGAPPMDGSKEDDQAGCTEKPYWGAAKKACSVNQYGAPPMDGSKDGQAEVPTAAATSKGLAAPTAGPAGALTPATKKRRVDSDGARDNACGGTNGGCNGQGAGGAHVSYDEGRARRRVGASMTVPAGAPTATTALTARSREAAAKWSSLGEDAGRGWPGSEPSRTGLGSGL
jgi:hypothetical protein